MMRIGRLTDGRSRPLRIMLKSIDSNWEVLSRAKSLKDNDKFRRMFILTDLTSKQHKELRMQLKKFRDDGEHRRNYHEDWEGPVPPNFWPGGGTTKLAIPSNFCADTCTYWYYRDEHNR